jgi:hypothetical protein
MKEKSGKGNLEIEKLIIENLEIVRDGGSAILDFR